MTLLADGLDRRLTPARRDLAAAELEGIVEAQRFVPGRPLSVGVEVADLRRYPRMDAGLETQLIYGDLVICYDEDEGWSWIQSRRDRYVGYVASAALAPATKAATHRVMVNRTFVYPAADLKTPPMSALAMDAQVTPGEVRGEFTRIEGLGFVFSRHLAPLRETTRDPVAVAESLLGTPYLWGGVSALGIDCSGLVQRAFSMAGVALPRDTDMQIGYGEAVTIAHDLGGLRRGDLVFWSGHVGIMASPTVLLHANAHHMLVATEPLHEARERILLATGLPVAAIRRLVITEATQNPSFAGE